MKKIGVFAFLLLAVFLFSLTAATNHTNESDVNASTSTDDFELDLEGEEAGFACLADKAGDCSGLTVQEIALTILATPDENFDTCVAELKSRESGGSFGNIRDTALAILALDHAGEDTTVYETWLLTKSLIPSDLIWYLEQDSNGETLCNIDYDGESYSVVIDNGKKIADDAGSCLSRAQSNFWFEIDSSCYDEEFTVACDEDFITTLLYKNRGSPTIYVLEGTMSAPAFDSNKVRVNSRCFGEASCDYEATAWATVALLKTGYDIEEYIPYVVAIADTNKKFLPEAFIYIITGYEDYITQLIADQKLGNFWLADASAYGKFYDTGLALVAIGGSSSEQVVKAKEWLLFSQEGDGCWDDSVRDTAMALWALGGRPARVSPGGGSVTTCAEANFYCIPSADCPADEDVGDNFYCSSLSQTCCQTENLRSCSELGGSFCSGTDVCLGNERKTIDGICCTGTCGPAGSGGGDTGGENECEASGSAYSCESECLSDTEREADLSCGNEGGVCCEYIGDDDDGGGSSGVNSTLLILILVVAIILVLVAIGYVYREKLQLMWFKRKSRFGNAGNERPPRGPGIPPRPGAGPPGRIPPRLTRRPPLNARPPAQARSPTQRAQVPRHQARGGDRAMDDTFKKLHEMSK